MKVQQITSSTEAERGTRGRRRLAAVVAAFALVAGGVVLAQPAAAANHCTADKVCLWDYTNYTGSLATRDGGKSRVNLATSARDKTSSWGNDTVYDGCLYDEPDGVDVLDELDSYSSDFFNIDRRDRAESWKTNGSC